MDGKKNTPNADTMEAQGSHTAHVVSSNCSLRASCPVCLETLLFDGKTQFCWPEFPLQPHSLELCLCTFLQEWQIPETLN